MRLEEAKMMKRFVPLGVLMLGILIVFTGYTNQDSAQLTPTQLLAKACGGTVLGLNTPPEFIPELRAAAANALAELVTDGRGQNAPFEIDLVSTWESLAGQGPNPECRAAGEILLPQIYLDPSREDNPFGGEFGLTDLISAVNSPPQSVAIELTRARVESLVILCRSTLFAGNSNLVVERLESVANGGTESIFCRGQEWILDGSNLVIQSVIADSLKGAYISQLGPITLASDIGGNDEERANKVCELLKKRLADNNTTESFRMAAAKAFAQGNLQAHLPPEFSFNCVSESELIDLTESDSSLADASVNLSAKTLAKSSKPDSALISIAENGDTEQEQLAAALALGIRWAPEATLNQNSGNIVINGADAIRVVTELTGSAMASAYILPIGQSWAGQAMDSAGHCVRVGGLGDCIRTSAVFEEGRTINLLSANNQTVSLAQTSNTDTNFKVITDEEVRIAVILDEGAEGLDLLPLSSTKPRGTFTLGITNLFTSGMPLGNVNAQNTLLDVRVHSGLLESTLIDFVIEEALAEFYEVSTDGQQVTFRVRHGVLWNDGIPFTISDVLFSVSTAFYCTDSFNEETGESSLEPFFDAKFSSLYSVDGRCEGLPAILSDTSIVTAGPNGILDTLPSNDDVIFGNRILPALVPLSNGQPGSNLLVSAFLETIPAGDDEIVHIAPNEIALIWENSINEPEGIGLDTSFCCLPQHILANSVDDALTENDPQILLGRWDPEELRDSPENFVGAGPWMLQHFGLIEDNSLIFVRNPNYWKTDENGGRLPKLEGLNLISFRGRPDAFLNACIDGIIDNCPVSANNKVLLQQSAEELSLKNYLANIPSTYSQRSFILNEDIHLADPSKEALGIAFRNPEVRRALSQSIDRRSITENIFQGDNFPALTGGRRPDLDIVAPACRPSLDYSELEEFCSAYRTIRGEVSFDIESANRRLDQIGIVDRDGDGIRDINVGFGFIVPGPNGLIDSQIMGDDLLLAGFEHSGLGLSDRDGDGVLDQDPGIIQPGPNGILDSAPMSDDAIQKTLTEGKLEFTLRGLGEESEFGRSVQTSSRASGIGIAFESLSLREIIAEFVLFHPSDIDGVVVSVVNFSLTQSLRSVYGSCANLHIHKRSECQNLETREPYQIRLDEMLDLAELENDPEIIARLTAEMQLLQTANLPWIYLYSPRNKGSVRRDRTNIPLDGEIPRAEILFRLDLQD